MASPIAGPLRFVIALVAGNEADACSQKRNWPAQPQDAPGQPRRLREDLEGTGPLRRLETHMARANARKPSGGSALEAAEPRVLPQMVRNDAVFEL